MTSSISDRSIYMEGSSEEEEEENVEQEEVDENVEQEEVEENVEEGRSRGICVGKGLERGAYEMDDSDLEDSNSPRGSRPNSYTTSWPQSYRQSIDIYSSVTPPKIGFLSRTPSALSRLGSSFLLSSTTKHTPDVMSSLIKPLLPSTSEDQHQLRKRSSHTLLLPPPPSTPTRKSTTKLRTEREVSETRHCSFTHAVLNGMNILCGVGILSTPYAIKEGGWIGLFLLVLFAILACYTGVLLRRCLDSEPGLETYPDIGQAAFGNKGRLIVSIILYLELYACCVEFIILESDNLSSLFPGAHFNFGVLHLNSSLLFGILSTLIVLPTTWLRDLSLLSYISAGGVIASIVISICLFWVGAMDGIGFHPKGPALKASSFPIAVGLYGYCYSGHAVFPNIYTSLKKPDRFSSVLFASFGTCTILFGAVAVMGYMMFGDSLESQFTLNMPHELVASKIAVWTTVVNPISKFALTLTPLALSLEELIPTKYMKTHMYAVSIRSALTISVLMVAISVPFFGLVMSFIGSLLTMLVTYIIPCACFLSILRGKVTLTEGLLCGFVCVVGMVSCALGTFSSLSGIVENLH